MNGEDANDAITPTKKKMRNQVDPRYIFDSDINANVITSFGLPPV